MWQSAILIIAGLWQSLAAVNYLATMPAVETFLPPPKVTVTAVGDMMFDRGVLYSVVNGGQKDFAYLFSQIPDLKDDTDILLGNLEGPAAISGDYAGNLYSFHMQPKVLGTLKAVGFDILNVANNHAGDWGRSGFEETLKNLKENNLSYTGGAWNYASVTKPVIFDKNGIKIGFLGFSDFCPAGLAASAKRSGILLASDPNFKQIISQAAGQVDALIVTIHFGDEYQPIHNIRQENLAQAAIDAGAKAVIGHHPHVVQDTEKYHGGFIAYSLGNFIFDQYFSLATMQGLVLKLVIGKDGKVQAEEKLVQLNERLQPAFVP